MDDKKMITDVGPAFPVPDLSKQQCPGMTLRDWFATMSIPSAMQMIKDTDAQEMDWVDQDGHYIMMDDGCESVARVAYMMADAMIKERNRKV